MQRLQQSQQWTVNDPESWITFNGGKRSSWFCRMFDVVDYDPTLI